MALCKYLTCYTGGIFRDPALFEKPEEFRPERFIEKPELAEIVNYVFGSGRVSLSTGSSHVPVFDTVFRDSALASL
jgi:cytochrome P450